MLCERRLTVETPILPPMPSTTRAARRPAPRKTPTPTLSDQIIAKYVTSKFDEEDKDFLPSGCVNELVTLEAIIKELRDKHQLEDGDLDLKNEPARQEAVDFICREAKKVFAITVVSGLRGDDLEYAMYMFMDNEFNDDSLPAEFGYLEEYCVEYSVWSKTRAHNFYNKQWKFLSPTFSQRNFNVNLQPNHILPFTKKSSEAKEGAFGHVFEVEIHPAHQEDPILNVR